MSQLDVQNILEGIKMGHQRFLDQQDVAARQEQLSQAKQAENNRVKEAQDRLTEEHNQFQVSQKAAEAMRKLQVLQTKQKIAENPQLLDALGTKTGSTTDAQGNTNVTYNIPGMEDSDNPNGSFTVPDALTQARTTAAQDAIINKPKYDQQNTLAQMQQVAALQRERETTQERLQAAQSHNDMMRMVAAIAAASREKVAGVGNTADTEDNSDILKGLLDASQSGPDVNKMFSGTKAGKARAMRIMGQALQNGIIPPSDTVKNGLANLASGMSIMPLYDQILSGKDENGKSLSIIDKYNKIKEMEGQVGNLTKGLDGMSGQRLNVPVLNKTIGAYLPGQFATMFGMGSLNQDKRNNLLRTINSQIDSSLSSYPAGQRAAIKKRVMGDKYYNELTPGANPTPNPNPSAATSGDYSNYKVDDFLKDLSPGGNQ